MPMTVRQTIEVTKFARTGLHRGLIRANPSIRFYSASKEIRRLNPCLDLGISLNGIIRIAVDPVVESQDRMKGSDLRDGRVLIPSELARFINNGIDVILTGRDLGICHSSPSSRLIRASGRPIEAYAPEGVNCLDNW